MKLDINCVRDVLLEFESLPIDCHTPASFPKSNSEHGEESVEYTLAKLKEAGYINADIRLYPNGRYDFYGIYDITFPGHQFLEKIRDNKVWTATKTVAGKVGSKAFDVIAQIASSVITQLITKYLSV